MGDGISPILPPKKIPQFQHLCCVCAVAMHQPEDITDLPRPDEKCVMLYVSMLHSAITSRFG